MADTTRSHSTRDRGKFARYRRAGAPRYEGTGLGRASKWAAAFSGLLMPSFPTIARLLELNCCAIPLTAAGGGSAFALPAEAVAGVWIWGCREATSFPSQLDRQELHILRTLSCPVVFIEIASDLEGQLDIISEVPEGSVRFSPDGRLPHTPSLVRLAAWDERCSGVDEGCVLPTPGSAEEEHASLLFANKLILTISGVSGMI